MKLLGWLIVSLFIFLAGNGQVFAEDYSSMTWNNSGWGNTDFGKSNWGNTNFGYSDWGNTNWTNTDWEDHVRYWQNEKPIEQLMKVTLGIKKPDGSCSIAVTWEKSSGDAMSAIAKNCQDCIISNLVNGDSRGAESFCQ